MTAVFKRWQDDLSLTYGEIARRTGLSVPSVSAIMRGESVPKPETLALICDACGHTESELIQAMAALDDEQRS